MSENSGNKKRNILILVVVLLLVGLIIGGTYAYLTLSVNVTNGVYNHSTECFDIDYDISDSGDGGTASHITGTLFQSANPNGGLSGRVRVRVNENCNVAANGYLYMYVSEDVSSTLVNTVSAHCEYSGTLETLSEYTTSSACTSVSGGVWVTNGSALKYAVYSLSDSSDGSYDFVSAGYVNESSKGTSINLLENSENMYFSLSNVYSDFYVYIWLDGHLADETYVNIPFSGYIYSEVVQIVPSSN